MSEHHSGFVVTLDHSITTEASDRIVDALHLIKGVISVKPIVDSVEMDMARERARQEIGDELFKAFKKIMWGQS